MNVRTQFVKYFFFFFNLFFAISGIAILGAGVESEIFFDKYLTFLSEKFLLTPVLLIISGIIVFVVALFLGCFGAIKENNYIIVTFAILLDLIFVMELATGLASYGFRDDVGRVMERKMYSSLQEFNGTKKHALTQLWTEVQLNHHCCGVNSYTDWSNNSYLTRESVPDSCCKTFVVGCGVSAMEEPENLWQKGCLHSNLKKSIENHVKFVADVGVGIVIVQLFGILFSIFLAMLLIQSLEIFKRMCYWYYSKLENNK